MASFLIHMCVCDEVNKVICKDRKKMLVGSIAPDIAKLVLHILESIQILMKNYFYQNIKII